MTVSFFRWDNILRAILVAELYLVYELKGSSGAGLVWFLMDLIP